MPVEIEVKMRLDAPDALEAELRSLGATCRGSVLEQNTYYDTPAADLRRGGQGLRLRIEQSIDGDQRQVIVTHKGPRAPGSVKSRQETQVHLCDAGNGRELLEALGYRPVLSFEKRRRRWQLDDCSVEIDTLPYLGNFAEIEGPDEPTILAVRRRIGMDEVPLIQKSYLGLLREHLKTHGISEAHVTFESAEG